MTHQLVAKGSPSKDFFVSMITRDLDTVHAVNDLIDNSVDGALRAVGEAGRFDGFEVAITANSDHFVMSDNCGGIPLGIAESYAFRFGRPPGTVSTDYSVGRFGIGMKRALFHLGTITDVDSCTSTAAFNVHIDVEEWVSRADESNWDFSIIVADDAAGCTPGTSIHVSALTQAVARKFGDAGYLNLLATEIQKAQADNLRRGLQIALNGVFLNGQDDMVLGSRDLQPAVVAYSLKLNETAESISVRLVCGLGESAPEAAGWYVYCNGRQVINADQTDLTVWGTPGIPKFHPQYNRFRGYAYLVCKDSDLLPWNTTKNGIDDSSEVYVDLKSKMREQTRVVLDFINDVKQASDLDEFSNPEGVLEPYVARSWTIRATDLRVEQEFHAEPIAHVEPGPRMTTIQYRRPFDQVAEVKDALNATSNREVGESTFDFFRERAL